MLHTKLNMGIKAAMVMGGPQNSGINFLTHAAKFSLHDTFACMPQAPSAGPPPSLAALRTNQPRAQGIDAPDRFSRRFLARPEAMRRIASAVVSSRGRLSLRAIGTGQTLRSCRFLPRARPPRAPIRRISAGFLLNRQAFPKYNFRTPYA